MTTSVPDLNYGDIYDALAPRIGDRKAIIQGDHVLTWKELDERSNRLARSLQEIGLQPDSKVSFYLKNCPAYAELWAACVKGRFVHVNINYRYVDHELEYLFDNSDSEAIVYETEFRDHIEHLKPKLTKVKAFIEVGDDIADFALDFESLCTKGNSSKLDIQRSGDDMYFMYTGGTTGYPKAVMWPQKQRIAAIASVDSADMDEIVQSVLDSPQNVSLAAAPLMHSTGLTTLMSGLARGSCIIMLPTPRFDAAVCLSEIQRNKVKRMAIVGDAFCVPLLQELRANPDKYDLSSIEHISSAGAMWSDHCKMELLEYLSDDAILTDGLGSSEGSGLGRLTITKGEKTQTGKFVVGANVKVFTEDLREVEPGSDEAGMIAKSGPLPIGYYKDPEKSAKTWPVIDGVRYSMAGDWCKVAADGTMTLLGRGTNCINTGGEKVYPEEVEDALKKVPGIDDAAVVGIPDERFGQAVAAVIKTTDDQPIDEESIKETLGEYIARYKQPRLFKFVEDGKIRHENGKINYRAVKQIAEG